MADKKRDLYGRVIQDHAPEPVAPVKPQVIHPIAQREMERMRGGEGGTGLGRDRVGGRPRRQPDQILIVKGEHGEVIRRKAPRI